jgi:hypothetical protein
MYFKRMHSNLHLHRDFVPLLSETDCLATKKLQSNVVITELSLFLTIILCFQKVGLNLFFWEQMKFSKILFQIIQPVSGVTCFKITLRDASKRLISLTS